MPRSAGGRVSGPGDRASKSRDTEEPTLGGPAEGHGGGLEGDWDQLLLPGSSSSARSHQPLARKPGDLGGASPPVVGGRQPREGDEPQAAERASEKSDAVVVPKKSAKTWVTPVESMEG